MIGALLLNLYGFWFIFLACMSLLRAWGQLAVGVKVLAAPGVLAGLLFDVGINLCICSFILWDRPREWTFTARLTRLEGSVGWRYVVATFICSYLLDPFQIGGHCRR